MVVRICVSDVYFTLKLKSKITFAKSDLSITEFLEMPPENEACRKRSLQKAVDAYSIYKPCKEIKNKIPVFKRK